VLCLINREFIDRPDSIYATLSIRVSRSDYEMLRTAVRDAYPRVEMAPAKCLDKKVVRRKSSAAEARKCFEDVHFGGEVNLIIFERCTTVGVHFVVEIDTDCR
jgi:hypothetical protein